MMIEIKIMLLTLGRVYENLNGWEIQRKCLKRVTDSMEQVIVSDQVVLSLEYILMRVVRVPCK